MKIFTSYFYQIRFFKPNMIPISTAMFDPKWYHNFKDKNYIFKDKNGVYNGFRAKPFVPIIDYDDEGCCKNCKQNPSTCSFIRNYRKQLNKLSFSEIVEKLDNLASKIKDEEQFEEEPIIVLIVYETPENRCSERIVIHEWFEKNGYPISELEYPIKA